MPASRSAEAVEDEAVPAWLAGGGETGALVRAFDWSKTTLGPIASWPPSLKVTVGTLLRSRHPMFLWWGPDLVQIYNDAYVPSFGRGKHPAAMGQRGRDCWAEIWSIIGPQIDAVMTRGEATWNEDHLVPVWRNGRIEEVYWTYGYSPVFSESGAISGTLVVCTETTSRVVAERRLGALRSLAQRLAAVTDLDAMVAQTAALLADTPGDVPFAAIHLADHGDAGPRLRATVGIEPETSTFLAPLGDGAYSPGFVVFGVSPRLPFDDAYRHHLLHLAEQMTIALRRIEGERARMATTMARDNLLLQAPVATALFRGPEHVFELANPLYCRMVNRFDLVGKTYREAFPELVETELPSVLDRVYRTGEPFSSGELLVRLDKGEGKLEDGFFTFNLEAIRDGDGRVYGMMAVALEITDQVNARRSLEQAQRERDVLLRELQAANLAKDEFLAMLGHELRNPLAPIVTALHLMRQRAEGAAAREQGVIERQVAHLVRLVDDLLDISKITSGKVVLKHEPVEAAEFVAKAVEIAGHLLESRRHQLVLDVPATGLVVDGDPVRLAQIVANLLTNAARYAEPGGTVSVRAFREDGRVVLQVRDDGIGISADLLPRIFERFVQGQQSADRKEGGLGLGLALVKSLVGMHEGTATVRSEGAGLGSEFEIRLPVSSRPRETRPPAGEARRAGGARRILIVDDNVDSAEMLSEMLLLAGHEIAVAHDGPSALTLAHEFLPEIAILDLGLPVMDGYELGKRLRESASTAACRLIALSGYGLARDRARTRALGFQAHLVKPVEFQKLLSELAADG